MLDSPAHQAGREMVHDWHRTHYLVQDGFFFAINKTPPRFRTVKCLHMTCGKYQNDVSEKRHRRTDKWHKVALCDKWRRHCWDLRAITSCWQTTMSSDVLQKPSVVWYHHHLACLDDTQGDCCNCCPRTISRSHRRQMCAFSDINTPSLNHFS